MPWDRKNGKRNSRPTGNTAIQRIVRAAVEQLEGRMLLTVDPYYAEQWALNNTGQTGGYVDADIDAPEAWAISQGSMGIVVGVLDTGIAYSHQDLYLNLWINQAEIPESRRQNLTDVDSDGLITFWDLNDTVNQGNDKITDGNSDGRIDASDLLREMTGSTGGWEDGSDSDTDANDKIDDLVGWNFVSDNNDPMDDDNNPADDHGHGTKIAGIIAAQANNGVGIRGVARVSLMALKVLDYTGHWENSDLADAIDYAVSLKTQQSPTHEPTNVCVLNASIRNDSTLSSVGNAISSAESAGMLFVAAAGNERTSNDVTPTYPGEYTRSIDNVIAVGATDDRDLPLITSNNAGTNYGSETVDMVAPGAAILATWKDAPYYRVDDGTSMATAVVSGVAALAFSVVPTASYSTVKNALLGGSDWNHAMYGVTVEGRRVNAARTLTMLKDRVTLAGGSGNDSIIVRLKPGDSSKFQVFVNDDNFADPPAVERSVAEVTWLSIDAGAGNDTIDVRDEIAIPLGVVGGDGNDSIEGSSGDDSLSGGTGDDTIIAGAGDDTLDGGPGKDSLVGGTGEDILFGAADDGIQGDTLVGGMGDDTYVFRGTGQGLDRITENTGEGVDWLNFSGFSDTIYLGLSGAASLDISASGTTPALTHSQLQLYLSSGAGIENVVGTPYSDSITGNSQANWLWGSTDIQNTTDDDTLSAGSGNDTLAGGLGDATSDSDSLIGGGGNDTYIFMHWLQSWYGSGDMVVEDANVDTDTLDFSRFTAPSSDQSRLTVRLNDTSTGNGANASGNLSLTLSSATGIENVIGTAYDDTLVGNNRNNTFWGGDGDDILDGGLRNDSLGLTSGADTLHGGNGNDTADYSSRLNGVNISLDGSANDGQAGHDSVLGGADNDRIYGCDSIGGGDNTGNELYGDGGDDTILGSDYADTIEGGSGADSIRGFDGADTITGDAGDDTVYGQRGNDDIDGGADDDLLYGDDPADTIGGGSDTIRGGAGYDTIFGGVYGDTLYADDDNDSDTLYGDAGDDTFYAYDGVVDMLNGGTGNDTGVWDQNDTLVDIP